MFFKKFKELFELSNSIKNSSLKYFLFSNYTIIFLISLIITIIWFRRGLLFATAEEGPVFYSLARTASIYRDVWVRWGTGFAYSVALPMALSAKILTSLEIIFTQIQTQAIVFFLLITSGMVGTYLLTEKLTKNKQAALFAGLFYFLNIYAMSQVWRRALMVGIFAWAYFPLY